jgi:hypothetical protein
MPGSTPLLSSVTLSEFTDLVEKTFLLRQKNFPMYAKQLYINDPVPKNTGDTRRYDEVDTETYALLKREGQNASAAQVGIGYNKVVTVKRIAREVVITWEMRNFNKFPQVTGQLTTLNDFCPQRVELDLTHRFTFCNASSYVDMDGQSVDLTMGDGNPMIYGSHPLKFSATTYNNEVTGDPTFSQSAIESAELIAVTQIYSNFGEKRYMDFGTIITSDDPNTIREVKKLLFSSADVDTSNSGVINTHKGRYNHIILHQLATTAVGAVDTTKRRWWFLGATNQGINGWQGYYGEAEAPNLKTPAAGNNGEDFHNDNWTYGVRTSYFIAIVSGKGIIAALPVSP